MTACTVWLLTANTFRNKNFLYFENACCKHLLCSVWGHLKTPSRVRVVYVLCSMYLYIVPHVHISCENLGLIGGAILMLWTCKPSNQRSFIFISHNKGYKFSLRNWSKYISYIREKTINSSDEMSLSLISDHGIHGFHGTIVWMMKWSVAFLCKLAVQSQSHPVIVVIFYRPPGTDIVTQIRLYVELLTWIEAQRVGLSR